MSETTPRPAPSDHICSNVDSGKCGDKLLSSFGRDRDGASFWHRLRPLLFLTLFFSFLHPKTCSHRSSSLVAASRHPADSPLFSPLMAMKLSPFFPPPSRKKNAAPPAPLFEQIAPFAHATTFWSLFFCAVQVMDVFSFPSVVPCPNQFPTSTSFMTPLFSPFSPDRKNLLPPASPFGPLCMLIKGPPPSSSSPLSPVRIEDAVLFLFCHYRFSFPPAIRRIAFLSLPPFARRRESVPGKATGFPPPSGGPLEILSPFFPTFMRIQIQLNENLMVKSSSPRYSGLNTSSLLLVITHIEEEIGEGRNR